MVPCSLQHPRRNSATIPSELNTVASNRETEVQHKVSEQYYACKVLHKVRCTDWLARWAFLGTCMQLSSGRARLQCSAR